ncbi:MAG: hypothetical protein IH623_19715 [Verrucomicrobia bacterium]|nr:hypothetical protein [Verrucomicrobiota bacterium]
MKPYSPTPRRGRHPAGYRSAFARLDAALAAHPPPDNSERLRLLYRAMFGDEDEPAEDGSAQLPEGTCQ